MSAGEICFIVPTYNEGKVLEDTLLPLLEIGQVIVVDDGSTRNSALSDEVASRIQHLQHLINRGQGAAIETGFEYIRQRMPHIKFIVTFDADGQHNSKDVAGMIELAQNGYDVVLGSRFLSTRSDIPMIKRVTLQTFAAIYSITNRKKVTDRHFGLRVLSRNFIENNHLLMSGFEHADEILNLALRGNWKYCEFPCSVTYNDYSQSKGQPLVNGLNILFNKVLSKL